MARGRVVIVAQPFKETLGSAQVGRAIARGVSRVGLEPEVILASDGGDGQVERWSSHEARDPLGGPVAVRAAWLDQVTAVVESRLVCGLSLLRPAERDPLRTTTRGVGELIDQVVRAGAESVVVGLGGSATVDGGV
ncbi:MAG: glycerate kinase, partial [Gemmatimonadales bacterium]